MARFWLFGASFDSRGGAWAELMTDVITIVEAMVLESLIQAGTAIRKSMAEASSVR